MWSKIEQVVSFPLFLLKIQFTQYKWSFYWILSGDIFCLNRTLQGIQKIAK